MIKFHHHQFYYNLLYIYVYIIKLIKIFISYFIKNFIPISNVYRELFCNNASHIDLKPLSEILFISIINKYIKNIYV